MSSNINPTSGDLLDSEAEALVNTVNCAGVMGKGLALQFKQRFPQNFASYKTACQRGEVVPGAMFVTKTETPAGLRILINFPTKRHWRDPSRMEDIDSGLIALINLVREHNIRSIAVPPLGCGLGGLDWNQVRPKIEAAFAPLPDVEVLLYVP